MTEWDARWKLAAILLACGLVAWLQTPTTAAIALVLSLLLAAASKVSPRVVLSRLALIAVSLLPFIIAVPFVESTTLAVTISLRALAIGTLALVLLPVHRTLAAAHSLGVPGPLIQIAQLTARYASSFFDEYRRLRIAWRVRGFHARCNRATSRTFAHGLGAILVRSDDRGERVSAAMRARGFDGRYRTLTPFRSTITDLAFSVVVVAAFAALAVLERAA